MRKRLLFLLLLPALQADLLFQLGQFGRPELEEHRVADRGAITLTGLGQESYWQIDDGSFAAFVTRAPDFLFTARIAAVEGSTASPKYGLILRSGLSRFERMVTLRHDGWEGNRCLQLFNRHERGTHPEDGARRMLTAELFRDWTAPEGLWLRLERRYPFVYPQVSRDGETWVRLPAVAAILDQELYVGLQVTGGGDGRSPVTVTFDEISFQELAADAGGLTRETLRVDWEPEPIRYGMHMAVVEPGQGHVREAHTVFFVKPEGMDWSEVRAVFVASGSKEIALRDRTRMAWILGEGGLRRPEGMPDWEGVFALPPLPAHYDVLAREGIVRLGGTHCALDFAAALRALARFTGQPHLEFLPGMATGASFAGGRSHRFASRFPDRALAAAPLVIGIPHGVGADPALDVPMLYIWGSIDGNHLRESHPKLVPLRALGAKSASAPMFGIGHRSYNSDALIWPFFLEMARERIPAEWDRTSFPELRSFGRGDGWITSLPGLDRSGMFPVQHPAVFPAAEAPADVPFPGWVPSEKIAHLWRHFVQANHTVRIVFPTFNQSQGFHNPAYFSLPGDVSSLQAGRPFDLIAAGPLGEGVEIAFFLNSRPLTPEWVNPANPYHIRVSAQEPGLHTLTLQVRRGGREYLSPPVSVVFHPAD